MKRIYKNSYLLAGICLIAGTLIGYLISFSAHQHINPSAHQTIVPSDHQHINPSAHQTIVPSDHQHINPSANQTIVPSDHQHISISQIWTCSMHPQVRQPEPGQCPLCGMDLIPASSNQSSSASPSLFIHEMTPEAVALANVHTSRVTGLSAKGDLLLTGKVQADERQLASITAQFPGRIEKLFVNFTGQSVQKGQRLATVYSPELANAQKELLEAASTKATFPELYASAREKLRLWKLSEPQINQIESTGEVSELFDVLADKSGVVTQRGVSVGDYVSRGSVLFQVVDLSKLWIMLDAYESDLALVDIGDEITYTVAAIPGKEFKATVSYIDPLINPGSRTASVRAEAANVNRELKPEMFVTARVQPELKSREQFLSIPRTALLWTGKRSVVYVKVPDAELPSYEMREITIGPLMGEVYVVEAGLEAGEEIVTNGVFAVDAAAQLSGNYSMMTRPETKTMEVPQVFREQLTAVADAYFDVKNALVASDKDKALTAAAGLEAVLDKVNRGNLSGQAHIHWMTLQGQMENALAMMENAATLEALRMHFEQLSDGMIEATESFGLEKETVYKHFCPMAFNDKGAFWLSEIEQIRNPYFGDAMLGCGEVKESYHKGQEVLEKEETPSGPSSGKHHH